MPGEEYRYLVELAMQGKLKPGAPRFDPSAIKDIEFENWNIIFNLGATIKAFALDDLNREEINIAYEYLTNKYDKEGWEEEGKSVWDPRPWMKPRWFMKYSFNAAIASFLIMLSVVVVILIISSYVYHQSSGPDFINDPQFREMNNLDTAVSIVENDSLFKEVATSGMVSSSSCSSVDPASRGYLNYTGQLYEVHMNTKGQPSYHFEALVDIDNRTVLNITRIKINQL